MAITFERTGGNSSTSVRALPLQSGILMDMHRVIRFADNKSGNTELYVFASFRFSEGRRFLFRRIYFILEQRKEKEYAYT